MTHQVVLTERAERQLDPDPFGSAFSRFMASLSEVCAVVTAVGGLADHRWPGLRAIGKVTRRREIGDRTSTETACFLPSTPLAPERPSEVARRHPSRSCSMLANSCGAVLFR